MEKYIYVSDRRLIKGRKVIEESNLALLDETSLKKAIDKKIIKKQKPQKDHGSSEQNVDNG